MNNVNYYDKLKNIEFFKIHPELIPYVGEKFDKYKILHVGESHYINQNENNEKYGVVS